MSEAKTDVKKTKKKSSRYYQQDVEKTKDNKKVEVAIPNLKAFSRVHGQKRLNKWKRAFQEVEPFPGDAPIPPEKIARYDRGYASIKLPKHGKRVDKLQRLQQNSAFAQKQAARAERLHDDESGFLETEEGEEVTQVDIANAVDVTSATKYFELHLTQFGPYGINYTRNGRHLLLGGGKGHVAAFDWQTKKLHCEFNAMETVHSVKWLHQETLFAAAQKTGVYVYDNQGIELHALTNLDAVLSMEFLPYHFLLCTANAKGFLAYTDVTMGVKVAGISTGMGRLDVMCQNPSNAIMHLGHFSGTVTLWSPSTKHPLVKMLCHKAGVRSVAVDSTGMYMATSGIDRKLRLWDLRTYKMLANYQIAMGAKSLAFSQTGALALATGSVVQIYKDVCQEAVVKPFLSHLCDGPVQQLQFCPFEDVLGTGHSKGFTSLIVPGSGEANIDAMEVNPLATKKQRQNAEVKLLLDKIRSEMISLTNKVTDIGGQTTTSKQQQQHKTGKKIGKKEKEQGMREKVRRSLKSGSRGQQQQTRPGDVLARFHRNQ